MTTKNLTESGYYKLINECSYSSIDHMHIQVQYILQMFDLFTIEWGEKKTEVFRNTLWWKLSKKLNKVNVGYIWLT